MNPSLNALVKKLSIFPETEKMLVTLGKKVKTQVSLKNQQTARFELGLKFDLMAAKKIPTKYGKLTLHAIFTELIGSLHNTLKIIFFQQNNLYSIIVDAWNKFASENGHFCG